MSIKDTIKGLTRNAIRFRYALILLGALILADGILTQGLINTGMVRESNPLLRVALLTGDFMAIKILGTLLAIIILIDLNRHHPKMAGTTVWSFILIYTSIVYWNVIVYLMTFK